MNFGLEYRKTACVLSSNHSRVQCIPCISPLVGPNRKDKLNTVYLTLVCASGNMYKYVFIENVVMWGRHNCVREIVIRFAMCSAVEVAWLAQMIQYSSASLRLRLVAYTCLLLIIMLGHI